MKDLRYMMIIRDIVNNFSDDEDIELCCDDDEDLEIGSSGAVNITYVSEDLGIPNKALVKEIVTHFGYTCYALVTIVRYAASRHEDGSSLNLDRYNFIRTIRDQCVSSTVHHNPMQTIHGVYLQCNEMMDAFPKLLPTAFSDNNYQAPPTHHFDMSIAPEFQQPYQSQTQTNTHPQAFTQQTLVPQQQSFQFQSFRALSDYSISHQFGSSSHYQETVPSMFGTTSTTPFVGIQLSTILSTYNADTS
ncbi:hypothetical protein Lal_00047118 [Lupinus albus]|nr:hypothetical protein Lal_00047118 [Lupinus albus]